MAKKLLAFMGAPHCQRIRNSSSYNRNTDSTRRSSAELA